jgi:hypothetical protein
MRCDAMMLGRELGGPSMLWGRVYMHSHDCRVDRLGLRGGWMYALVSGRRSYGAVTRQCGSGSGSGTEAKWSGVLAMWRLQRVVAV